MPNEVNEQLLKAGGRAAAEAAPKLKKAAERLARPPRCFSMARPSFSRTWPDGLYRCNAV